MPYPDNYSLLVKMTPEFIPNPSGCVNLNISVEEANTCWFVAACQ